jgi:TetR/AcrR family tetracycline transcriptional repressor
MAHRDGARLVATASWLSPATIRTFDQELTAMVERGFTPALTLHTIAAISRYVTGFVLQEQRTRMMSDGTAPDDPLEAVAQLLDRGTEATLLQAIRDSGVTAGCGRVGAVARALGARTVADIRSYGLRT